MPGLWPGSGAILIVYGQTAANASGRVDAEDQEKTGQAAWRRSFDSDLREGLA